MKIYIQQFTYDNDDNNDDDDRVRLDNDIQLLSPLFPLFLLSGTEGQTERQTDRGTNRKTDGRTQWIIEMCG